SLATRRVFTAAVHVPDHTDGPGQREVDRLGVLLQRLAHRQLTAQVTHPGAVAGGQDHHGFRHRGSSGAQSLAIDADSSASTLPLVSNNSRACLAIAARS